MFLHKEGIGHFIFQIRKVAQLQQYGANISDRESFLGALFEFRRSTIVQYLQYAQDIEQHLAQDGDNLLRKLQQEVIIPKIAVPTLIRESTLPEIINKFNEKLGRLEKNYEAFTWHLKSANKIIEELLQPSPSQEKIKLAAKAIEDLATQAEHIQSNSADLAIALKQIFNLEVENASQLQLLQDELRHDINQTDRFKANLSSWLN